MLVRVGCAMCFLPMEEQSIETNWLSYRKMIFFINLDLTHFVFENLRKKCAVLILVLRFSYLKLGRFCLKILIQSQRNALIFTYLSECVLLNRKESPSLFLYR
jgi:hypothetical protein